MLKHLEKMDRRWLYLMMALCISIPHLAGIQFPIVPGSSARKIYDAIEALPDDAVVWVSCDYDPGSEAELYPMNLALFHQLGKKKVRVIVTWLWPQGGPLVEQAMDEAYIKRHGREYGEDIVTLGYKAGGQILISKLMQAVTDVYPEDTKGTPLAQLPVMKGVNNLRDVDFFMIISAGTPGTKEWVQQCQSRTGIPMGSGVTAVSAPDFFTYENANQLVGLLGGLKGAAAYEKLVGLDELAKTDPSISTRGIKGMGPQSFGHLLIILFIILGNVGYLLARRKAKGGA